MKKIYFLIAMLMLGFSAHSQYSLDFDDMSVGDVVDQSEFIILWPDPTITSSQVTTAQAFSGNNSMVTRPQSGGNIDDVLMQLGNLTSGTHSVRFMMYVPTGATGFWNIQNEEDFASTADAQWNGQFFVGQTASGGEEGLITFDQNAALVVPYPENEWFSVTHVLDLDAGTHTLDINGNLLLDAIPYNDTDGAPAFQLGSINYFAIDADNEYYVDDFELATGNLLNSSEFSLDSFSVYPNPVLDILNLRSASPVQNLVIYDILGKQVLRAQPDAISSSIDMSSLPSGAYIVNVTINGTTQSVKVIK